MQNVIKGFTLVEMLVVVLIIGILAAIAVPQYQKAVKKSQGVEAILNLKTLKRAQEAYYLANGKYTNDLSKLDLTFNAGAYWYHCYTEDHFGCYAYRADGKKPFFELAVNSLYCRGSKKDCEAFSNNAPRWDDSGNYWLIQE